MEHTKVRWSEILCCRHDVHSRCVCQKDLACSTSVLCVHHLLLGFEKKQFLYSNLARPGRRQSCMACLDSVISFGILCIPSVLHWFFIQLCTACSAIGLWPPTKGCHLIRCTLIFCATGELQQSSARCQRRPGRESLLNLACDTS